jgi:hypothetical protein
MASGFRQQHELLQGRCLALLLGLLLLLLLHRLMAPPESINIR